MRIAAALTALTCAGAVAAKPEATEGHPSTPAASPEARPDGHRLKWTYPRFRVWQYVSSFAVSGTNLYLQYGTGDFPEGRWNEPLPLDEPLRDGLRADTARGRENAAVVSDYLWDVSQYYAVIVDSLLVPLAFDNLNFDVAWQMSMLNWQAIGAAFLVTRTTHVLVGRSRPSQYDCSTAAGASNPCVLSGPSFISGHFSMAMTGAGLACAHHSALPLYGGGWPDAAICALLTATATTTGVLRVVADKHWPSDVVAGGLVGWASGFGLPWLLHYQYGEAPQALGAGVLPPNMAFLPMVSDTRLGLGVGGYM